jgi:SP family sugar:H+ symporter-like MFS transporter
MSESHKLGFTLFISMIATIGGFLFGFDSGVINGTISGLQKAFNSASIGTGFNVSSMLLGCAVGAFFAGRLGDIFGRKKLLIVAAVLFIISAWGSGIAGSSFEFIIYRILGGLAVGAASVMAPAYIAEVAPAHLRGALTTIQQVAIISGLFAAFLSNYLLAGSAGTSTDAFWMGFEAWRWMFWMELIPALLFFVLLFFIPESPRFLVATGKTLEANTVLNRLMGSQQAAQKQQEIVSSISNDANAMQLRNMFDSATGKIKPIIWIGIGLAIFQQLVGINVVFYYGAVLWQAAGFSESDSLLINVVNGAVSIAACLITIYLIDKIGRKPLLKWGSIGMTISLGTMVVAFANASFDASGQMDLGDWGVTALIGANVFVFFFNASWGPVMWVMLSEMFPNRMRGTGLAIAGLAQWFANFIVSMTFPILLVGIGLLGAYSLYAISALISVFFVIKFVRETNGIELEAMQE